MELIVAVPLIASAVTVSIAGHHGAMLVHMEGIGPMGKGLESVEDHHHDIEHRENKSAMYQCPMHPEVTSEKSGTCPKCGMQLEKKTK